MAPRNSSQLRKLVVDQLLHVRGAIVLGILCVVGYALTQLLAPWPLKLIFDHILLGRPVPAWLPFIGPVLQAHKTTALVLLSLGFVGIALLGGLFSYAQIYLTSRVGYQIVHRLRRDLFNHLQRLSLSFHHRARSGELLTKVTGDTQTLRDVFTESVFTFIVQMLMLVGMFAVMMALNWKLALIVLGTFPVLSYALYYVYQNIRKSARRQRRKEGKLAARISEILSVVSLVQAFGREKYEAARFESESAESLDESIRAARIEAAASRTVEIIGAAGSWGVILFGSLQVLEGALTPGDLLVFAAYVNQVYKPIRNLVKLSVKFSKATVSAHRIAEIFEIEPEIEDSPDAIDASGLEGRIAFANVFFDYGGGRPLLANVSFVIDPGERVALTGVSGAGKSTLVSLILRLYEPSAGSVSIDGVSVSRYKRESLRREIGVVLQDSLLLGATVRENIAYGKPDATQAEIVWAARQAHADDFIMALPDNYETVVGERGVTLSGGQRQRIALARALIKQPAILILDEPTSAIDSESESLIWHALERLQKGKTIVVIAHQFSTIKRCDRVLVLQQGEVFERPRYREAL